MVSDVGAADSLEAALHLIVEFFINCNHFVVRTGVPAHFVTYEDHTERKRTTTTHLGLELRKEVKQVASRLGFESVLCRFAEQLGYGEQMADWLHNGVDTRVAWGEHPLDETLDAFGVQRRPVVVERLEYLYFLPPKAKGTLGWRFYVLQAVSVCAHLVGLCGPALFLIGTLIDMKRIHARTMDPARHPALGTPSISPYDFLSVLVDEPGRLSEPFVVAWWFLISFCMAVWLNLLVVYMSRSIPLLSAADGLPVPMPAWLQAGRRTLFKWTYSLFLFVVLAVLLMCAVWCLLAAILDPFKFLPWASAMVTFILVLAWKVEELKRAAEKLSLTIKEQYTAALYESVRRLENAQRNATALRATAERRERRKALRVEPASLRPTEVRHRSLDKSGVVERPSVATEEAPVAFDPGHLFDLLNTDGSPGLTRTEFMGMFVRLDLNVSEGKRQLMFTYANSRSEKLDAVISREEFIAAWQWLEETMADSMAGTLGLSRFQMSAAIVSLALLLVGVLAFLLIAIVAFNTNGGFSAVVQSAAIAQSGLVAKWAQKKPKAQELDEMAPDAVKGLIKLGVTGSKDKD